MKQSEIKFSGRFQKTKLQWWSRRIQMKMSTATTKRRYAWVILDHIIPKMSGVRERMSRVQEDKSCCLCMQAKDWIMKAKNQNVKRKIMMKIYKFLNINEEETLNRKSFNICYELNKISPKMKIDTRVNCNVTIAAQNRLEYFTHLEIYLFLEKTCLI